MGIYGILWVFIQTVNSNELTQSKIICMIYIDHIASVDFFSLEWNLPDKL